MPLWILNITGWCWSHKRVAGSLVLFFVVALAIIMLYRGCRSDHKLQIDPVTMQKVNSADEKEKKAALQEVIEKNADVVTTVDQRNAIQDSSDVEKQADINSKIEEADRKIIEAKSGKGDVSSSDLECILVPAHCK